jgi:hypothetical protein
VREEDDATMRRIADELRTPVRASASIDARVMRAVRRLPRHSRFRLWSRLTSPRRVTVTPLSWMAVAAGIAVFAALGTLHAFQDLRRHATPAERKSAALPKSNASRQPVQFVLIAPAAKKVALVGDFNGWDAAHVDYQAEHRGGGVWSVTARVPVGHHRYSFVVDDSVWMADPIAPRAVDNDFGLPNSAIVVQEHE